MNRIIIIGNGFDLAHGLATRYEDFINWYWDKWLYKLRLCHEKSISDGLCTFTLKATEGTWYSFLWDKISIINTPKGVDVISNIWNDKESFEVIQSHLLSSILKSINEKKWVDIENEYYQFIKQSITRFEYPWFTIEKLNVEFEIIRSKLIEYLQTISNKDIIINDNIKNIIFSPFKPNDISIGSIYSLIYHFKEKCYANRESKKNMDFFDSLSENDIQEELESCLKGENYPKDFLSPNNILLLNFNYTNTIDEYVSDVKGPILSVNHIHGNLKDSNNIIFGYGDELDDDYKSILKCNNKEYLKNIKSVKYMGTNNYRNMLAFIESAPYQIYIMGHSCGNSDRTLLNTLFEHKNCVSIKPYYYKREDGSDNYFDIIQNISRNFTDMKLMRNRVVNKTFCEPLPQNKVIDNK